MIGGTSFLCKRPSQSKPWNHLQQNHNIVIHGENQPHTLIICLIWFDLNITKIHVYCLNPQSGLRICLSSLVGDDRILYWPWFDWVWIDLRINMIKHSLIFSDVDDSVFTVSQSFGWVVSTQLFDEGGGVLSYPPWEFYYIYTFQDNVICFHWIRSRKWRTEKYINTK